MVELKESKSVGMMVSLKVALLVDKMVVCSVAPTAASLAVKLVDCLVLMSAVLWAE